MHRPNLTEGGFGVHRGLGSKAPVTVKWCRGTQWIRIQSSLAGIPSGPRSLGRERWLVCREQRQTLEGKSPKLSRISYTSSSKLDELPTDLDTKVFGSIRIKKGIMRPHYQPDRFKSVRQLSNQFRIIERIMRAHLFPPRR